MEEINMRVLENCEPKQVFYYFEEICKIPHGSRNTKQISTSSAGCGRSVLSRVNV